MHSVVNIAPITHTDTLLSALTDGKKEKKEKCLKIPVPEGCKGGDPVRIIVNGRPCSVHIPKGKGPGDVFCIRAPHFPGADTDVKKTTVTVTVPDGSAGKDMLTFNGPGDKLCTVIIPSKLVAGDEFKVTLPSVLESVEDIQKRPHMVKITLPAQAQSGDELTMQIGGKPVQVSVPPGMRGGDSIRVEVPGA